MRPHIILLLLFLAVLPLSAIADLGQPWKPIPDVSDPHIQSIGKFAVAEFNRQRNTDLIFKSVLSGKVAAIRETRYLLHLAVEWEEPTCYDALVLELDPLEVLSFESKTC
ncbi:hypothetical protein ACJRO7_017709 [Eucalyptus globulus]|uniref:Cystatin domain-containing protein n=1 Tax=Eucalyptus globulus TaxID=34317 RepID=A0ABD3KSA7_EUCGL